MESKNGNMAACTYDSLKKKKKINPVTADDLNNTYCDMGERDSHKAFKDMKDHCKLCDKCLALICRGCYTGGSDEE